MTRPPIHIHLMASTRDRYLERNAFYTAEIKARLFVSLANIPGEAEQYRDEAFAAMCKSAGEEDDIGDLAESAHEQAVDHYNLLTDLKSQMMLATTAGLYHQWERDLRDFLETDLGHYFQRPTLVKEVWHSQIREVFDILKMFGWDCRVESVFPRLDACRLLVNAYKHGKGGSLSELAKRYPEYIPNPIPETSALFFEFEDEFLDPSWLDVSETRFDAFSAAIADFWTRFPEISYFQR